MVVDTPGLEYGPEQAGVVEGSWAVHPGVFPQVATAGGLGRSETLVIWFGAKLYTVIVSITQPLLHAKATGGVATIDTTKALLPARPGWVTVVDVELEVVATVVVDWIDGLGNGTVKVFPLDVNTLTVPEDFEIPVSGGREIEEPMVRGMPWPEPSVTIPGD